MKLLLICSVAENAAGEEGPQALAAMAVDVLRDMKSPGCEYLCLADRKYPRPEELEGKRLPAIKPADEDARIAAWREPETDRFDVSMFKKNP